MKYLNRKKGEVVLKDIMMMIIIFAGFMALASMFVQSLAEPNAYDNTGMLTEYNQLGINGLGNDLINTHLKPGIEGNMVNATGGTESGGTISSFKNIDGVIWGVGSMLSEVLRAPSYIGGAVGSVLTSTGWVSYTVATLIKTIINLLIYTVIVFVIISALLKGGRM